jgi:hypothetical protein
MDMFPDYAASGVSLEFHVAQPSDYCDGFTEGAIRCPAGSLGVWATNKLMFHEINHKLTWGDGGYKHDYSQACDSKEQNCNSSEFQATLLEEFYFPENCSGSTYVFIDKHGISRTSSDILEILLQEPGPISEAELWDYAMGRSDSLAAYAGRFNLMNTFELFASQKLQ